MHRRHHTHRHRHGLRRWLERIPRSTMATAVVGLLFMLVLLLMLVWRLLTGVWLFDTIITVFGGGTV
jgi:uncharacterized protein YacL